VTHQALGAPRRDGADVRLADDLNERSLGPTTGLEQPIGEVAALTGLGNGQVDRGGPVSQALVR
jgi:hypothetical protein